MAAALLIFGGALLGAYALGMPHQRLFWRVSLVAATPLRAGHVQSMRLIAGQLSELVPAWVRAFVMRHRMVAIAAGLPDALELLVICVEAGLSLEEALARTAHELEQSQPELARQLDRTSAELRVASSRDEALANLATRIGTPAIRALASALSQTMRYGTPLAQALHSMAKELRDESLIALEERANRLPALMTVPMMLFIMPTIFLIVGGPAALHVIDTFLR